MLEKLLKLLSDANNENDSEKKISLFEEYSDSLEKFLNNPSELTKYSKQELEKLSSLHNQVQKEVKSIFTSFKKDIKDFQKVTKGIKAYIGMPKSVTTRSSKKG